MDGVEKNEESKSVPSCSPRLASPRSGTSPHLDETRVFHHSNWTALGWARLIWRTPIYIRPLSFIFIYMHSFNKIDLLQSACLRKNPEDQTRIKLGSN